MLYENATTAQSLINCMLKRIEQEENEDEENRFRYKDAWTLVPSFEVNNSYITRIKGRRGDGHLLSSPPAELQEDLRDGETIDTNAKQKYNELKNLFEFLREGEEQKILDLIPAAPVEEEKQEFAAQFREQLHQIYLADEKVRSFIATAEREANLVLLSINIHKAFAETALKKLNRKESI